MRPTPPSLRAARERRGLTQAELAERAGVSRQSLGAIEAGRARPSVDLALRLAAELGDSVEALFGAPQEPALLETEGRELRDGERVVVAEIGGRWVAHGLREEPGRVSADGVTRGVRGERALVAPFRGEEELARTLLVSGCAPGLGLVAERLNAGAAATRWVWLPRSNAAALGALARGHVHLAGLHLSGELGADATSRALRAAGVREATTILSLGRWEVGWIGRRGDRRTVRAALDLGRRGLRVVRRERGAGTQELFERSLRRAGLPVSLAREATIEARGHLDVARAVALGAADVGVASRDAALALDLEFSPLAEERYDLAVPSALLADGRVARFFEALAASAVRRELEAWGYDVRAAGARVAEVEAA